MSISEDLPMPPSALNFDTMADAITLGLIDPHGNMVFECDALPPLHPDDMYEYEDDE